VNPTFLLGGELEVRRLGFGAMRIVADREEGVRVVRRAVELGVTLIDTADIYGAGVSEEVIAAALHPYPEGLVLATKGGLGYGSHARLRDGRPEYLRRACEASLRRLRLERIDLYQLHRHDPEVPIEESVGALEQLRREGKIRLIGLSNVSVSQLRAAQTVARIVSVQNEYNRGLLTSEDVLAACEAEGLGFFPWRPLGEGLRDAVSEIRWLLDRSPVLLPIPGTSKVEHLEENMRAVASESADAPVSP
jgi:pyridoxine 4-dehydrogenase